MIADIVRHDPDKEIGVKAIKRKEWAPLKTLKVTPLVHHRVKVLAAHKKISILKAVTDAIDGFYPPDAKNSDQIKRIDGLDEKLMRDLNMPNHN